MTQFYTHSSAGTIIGTAGAEGEWWSGTFNFDGPLDRPLLFRPTQAASKDFL